MTTEKREDGKQEAGERREALGVDHKRLLYCVNVNRTSLDHLLLGESADIDQMSNDVSITPDGKEAGGISCNSSSGSPASAWRRRCPMTAVRQEGHDAPAAARNLRYLAPTPSETL